MQNMYNYKKPSNYYQQIKDVKQEPVQVMKNAQPKAAGSDYLEQRILGAKPEELTLMLYDGIVKFLKQAEIYIEQNHIEKTNNALLRVQDILDELNVTLNMEYEVSHNLRALYVFMKTQLVEANVKKDLEIIGNVLELAIDLRDTWKEAIQKVNDTEVEA